MKNGRVTIEGPGATAIRSGPKKVIEGLTTWKKVETGERRDSQITVVSSVPLGQFYSV